MIYIILIFQQNIDLNGILIPDRQEIVNMQTYFKIFIFLYASDTVILADSKGQLRNALNTYEQYCNCKCQ